MLQQQAQKQNIQQTTRVQNILRSPWLRPLNDADMINDWLAQANPMWSLDQVRARVVDIIQETPDTRTFVLRTNHLWRGHAAGQHVVIEVEIAGVRYQRTYTLASAPDGSRQVSITVKRQQGGKVSRWLHDRLRVGDVIGLSRPMGEFVLPAATPDWLLMLSAGSGITPVMSVLRELKARGYTGHIVFLHSCRDEGDAIFRDELKALARDWPSLQLEYVHTAADGRMDAAEIKRRVPDYSNRHTLLCGPSGFMQMVKDFWKAEGLEANLQCEHFGLAPIATRTGDKLQATLSFARSNSTAETAGNQPLLVDAEQAGLKPKHGCRIGICQSCKCKKISGTVENLLTGEISAEPGEMIQLCVSAARSDVVIDV